MRAGDVITEVLALMGRSGEVPSMVEVHFNALIPNGRGIYAYVQLRNMYASAHFTTKGSLIRFERSCFHPDDVSFQTDTFWHVYQHPKENVQDLYGDGVDRETINADREMFLREMSL